MIKNASQHAELGRRWVFITFHLKKKIWTKNNNTIQAPIGLVTDFYFTFGYKSVRLNAESLTVFLIIKRTLFFCKSELCLLIWGLNVKGSQVLKRGR